MKNLQLSLIKKWFDMTEYGEKPEDYRKLTPYWCNRFLLYEGEIKTVKWWSFMQNYEGCFFQKAIESNIENGKITFKNFETNTMTLGYPSKNDTSKILTYKHAGIHIGEGKPEWGAEKGKLYFVIKHGDRIG